MRISKAPFLCCIGLMFALTCFSPRLLSQTAALSPYGACPPPAHEGVNVCVPGNGFQVTSPFQVIAAGTSGRAAVRDIELWADGTKLGQSQGTPFDQPVTLAVGTHHLTAIEVDTLGSFVKSTPFTVIVVGTIQNNCAPPAAPGVHICTPIQNGCNTQPWVEIQAAGTGASGVVSRMELWNNGTKLANFSGNRINTAVIMLFGTVTIYEVDSKGAALSSSIFYDGPC